LDYFVEIVAGTGKVGVVSWLLLFCFCFFFSYHHSVPFAWLACGVLLLLLPLPLLPLLLLLLLPLSAEIFPYNWMNGIVAVGALQSLEEAVVIDCWRLTNFPGKEAEDVYVGR